MKGLRQKAQSIHVKSTVGEIFAHPFLSENLRSNLDISRPDKTTSLWSSVDPPLPVAACVQREILLSVSTHLHILCPEGSDEVTKSSVRMQEIHFQSKQMCSKKVLFQSHAVLFLSKHTANIERVKKKKKNLPLPFRPLSLLFHHLHV